MFVVLLTYMKPIEEVERVLADHISFLQKCYADQKFICSGPKVPRTGGMILMNVASQAEVQTIISEDPFHKHNIAKYEIVEFLPTRFDARFSCFIEPTGEIKVEVVGES